MRFVVYGVGAIGGTVAAALALSGQNVIGIARGAQLAAIKDGGLLLRTPDSAARAAFPCVADPAEIAVRPDDAILLTMKSQDTVDALQRLRAAGFAGQPIFCIQNGVANERFALRRFPEVHGVTVMMPATFTTPGEVAAFSSPRHGVFDIGRYPAGSNAHDDGLAQALEAANIAAFVMPDVMQSKYGKLLLNLGNILEAALGPDADRKRFLAPVRAEAEAASRRRQDRLARSRRRRSAPRPPDAPAARRGSRRASAARRRRALPAAPARSRPTTSTARSCSSAVCTACRFRRTPISWS